MTNITKQVKEFQEKFEMGPGWLEVEINQLVSEFVEVISSLFHTPATHDSIKLFKEC